MAKEELIGFIVRHGETSENAQGNFRGWVDVPLNSKGTKQAKAAAAYLSKFPIKQIICSPLLRAFVTADTVAQPHGLPVSQHRGLFPLNVGMFTGKSRDDTMKAFRLFIDHPDVTIPGGESLEDFEARQFAFFGAILKAARGKGLIVFVAHTSNVVSLESFTNGENDKTLEPEAGSETVNPGGIAAIWFDGKRHRTEPVFGQGEKAVFGSS